MKILLILFGLAAVLGVMFFYGCIRSTTPTLTLNNKPEGKILIAYYSQSPNQNTGIIAEWIHRQVGGDIFEIEMVTPYSDSYRETLEEAKRDNAAGIKPEIKPLKQNPADYDIIFIGSPVWFGTYAPPVGSFLASADWTGKVIAPFCTHGGGGAGTLYADMAAACPKATILEGLAARGSNVVERVLRRGTAHKESPDLVIDWLNRIIVSTHTPAAD